MNGFIELMLSLIIATIALMISVLYVVYAGIPFDAGTGLAQLLLWNATFVLSFGTLLYLGKRETTEPEP